MLTHLKPFILSSIIIISFIVACSETGNEEALITIPIQKDIEQESQNECEVASNWMFAYIKNGDGESVKRITSEDFMTLSTTKSEKFFYYHLKEAKIFSSGLWETINDTLVFHYDPKPDSIFYDSIAHVEKNGMTICAFFEQGTTKSEMDLTGVERKTRKYKMKVCDGDSLIIEENGISYAFSK